MVQSALMEERAARDSVKSKRQEMDSVQLMINKVKNAIAVEDIDGRVTTHSLFLFLFYLRSDTS